MTLAPTRPDGGAGATVLRIVVNGRFLTRAPTGVDRVAEEVLRAWDELLARDESLREHLRIEVVAPRGRVRPHKLRHIPLRQAGRMRGHLWEQLELPRLVGTAWLYNPCNTGPLAVRRCLTTIHDAQIYLIPHAYSWRFRLWYRVLLPRLARRAALVTTVSAFSRAMLERFGVAAAGRLDVIPNGGDHVFRIAADTRVLGRFDLTPGGYFLALGSLSPHKNLEVVLQALHLRRDTTLPLVVAGDGRSRVFAGAGLPEASSARYIGRVDDRELKALYENATALLFPSLFEGFGLPPLEAMGCGCAVLASSAASIPETCGDAVLYADPRSVQDWADGMDRLSRDAEFRDRLREAGRRRAAAFSWNRTASRLLELIQARSGRSAALLSADGRAQP